MGDSSKPAPDPRIDELGKLHQSPHSEPPSEAKPDPGLGKGFANGGKISNETPRPLITETHPTQPAPAFADLSKAKAKPEPEPPKTDDDGPLTHKIDGTPLDPEAKIKAHQTHIAGLWANREMRQARPVIDCPAKLHRLNAFGHHTPAPTGQTRGAMISEWTIGVEKHKTLTGVDLEIDRLETYLKRLKGSIEDLQINWETTPCHPCKYATIEDRQFDAMALATMIASIRQILPDVKIHTYGPCFITTPGWREKIDINKHLAIYQDAGAIGDTLMINGYLKDERHLEDLSLYESMLHKQADELTIRSNGHPLCVITSPITRFEGWRTTLFDTQGRKLQQDIARIIARYDWTHLNWYEPAYTEEAHNFPLVV